MQFSHHGCNLAIQINTYVKRDFLSYRCYKSPLTLMIKVLFDINQQIIEKSDEGEFELYTYDFN